jgi:uncharacterized membrane protein YkoI
MRRGLFTALLLAALAAAAPPIEAQVRLQPQRPQMQKPPRINKPPVLPPVVVIPPSQALKIAGRSMPNAKPLNVKLMNNNNYVITLRKNNVVTRVIVNAQTGALN